ncbi:uncharacterized protein LOC111345899, partial [Stylophora pistillata]|uniref:uncharacterized protein LOC111345899 n=1 Tax=Stylophora pistillata TaxID=50429 RepID=UPI000C04BC8C
VLADVNNNEENVYIQHRHNGDKSWLGFNDRSTESDSTWVDRRGRGNFTAWANNQPNNFKEEDCVHALGVKYSYEWNDVQCSDCHKFTCKKDLNECQNDLNYCHNLATCTNERGSHKCKCKAGYVGDGFDCYYSYAGLGHSAILANDDNYLGTLSNWLSRVVQSQSSYWKRCWRASVDGWPASTFHSLCDNKGPTVTIIRVGKYIFGGYTSSSWTSGCSWLCRSTAFLFSLVNKPGWGPVKLSQPGQHDSYSSYTTYGCSHRGPSFGGAHDIYIPYHASNTKSESQLGYTYSPPTGYNYGSSFAKSFLAGGYNFRPGEVEVFYETF